MDTLVAHRWGGGFNSGGAVGVLSVSEAICIQTRGLLTDYHIGILLCYYALRKPENGVYFRCFVS